MAVTVPGRPPTVLPAPTLLLLAQQGLDDAASTPAPGQRYALAHLAALRGAAAVLACRARPAVTPAAANTGGGLTGGGLTGGPTGSRRGRPTSAWVLLSAHAPELAEWATFFAAGARKRAAAEAGLVGVVTPREADDLLRDATSFLAVVQGALAPAGSRDIDARAS